MSEEYNWDKNDALRLWSFGCPPDGKPNCIVDQTKGASFLAEIKDHVVGAFLQYTGGGVFCDEPLRGVRFNLQVAGAIRLLMHINLCIALVILCL